MSISDYFNKQVPSLNTSLTTPSISSNYVLPVQKVPKGTVGGDKLAEALRFLESSYGLDKNTPRNQRRTYTIPAFNGNESNRTINYNSGYGGEYGLTPVALGTLAKSSPAWQPAGSTYGNTKYGKPLTSGASPDYIQTQLQTPEGAGKLAIQFFHSVRPNPQDFTPITLANDYINYYVGKDTKNDTPQNRKRALDYFTSIMQK